MEFIYCSILNRELNSLRAASLARRDGKGCWDSMEKRALPPRPVSPLGRCQLFSPALPPPPRAFSNKLAEPFPKPPAHRSSAQLRAGCGDPHGHREGRAGAETNGTASANTGGSSRAPSPAFVLTRSLIPAAGTSSAAATGRAAAPQRPAPGGPPGHTGTSSGSLSGHTGSLSPHRRARRGRAPAPGAAMRRL